MRFYIHIPFCKRKCSYCSFSSFGWISEDIKKKYLSFLKDEIISFLDSQNISSCESVYIWWWTPSLLDSKEINSILDPILKRLDTQKTEITIELNPENITSKYIEELLWIGINRFSVWVQSLYDNILKASWRCDKTIILNAFRQIIDAWARNIWADFIIWLPYSDSRSTSDSIIELVEIFPEIKHISIYMLEDNDYPEDWSKNLPAPEEISNWYINSVETLKSLWFLDYEISNFSKPWFECSHNLWYWQHDEYRWFWLWASSFIWKKRFSNGKTFPDYFSKNLSFFEELSDEDITTEKLMFEIRSSWLNRDAIKNKDRLKEFLKSWFLETKWYKLHLTTKWATISDYILTELIF